MTGHITGSQLDRYLSRNLSASETLAFHDHVEACPACRETLASAVYGDILPDLEEPTEIHLLEEEMVPWVAGRAPEAEKAGFAEHVASCSACRDSVEAMRAAAKPQPRPIARFAVLAVAAALVLAAGAAILRKPAIVASLDDASGRIALDSSGGLTGISGSEEEQAWVRDALSHGRLPAGPGTIAAPTSALRDTSGGEAPPFTLTSPVGVRVLEDRPVFTWQTQATVTDYEVVVTSESLEPLARSGKLQTTEWKAADALPRGVPLLWQVRASVHGATVTVPAPPAPPARFEIASAEVAQRLAELRQNPRYSHLLAAALCAHEGLRTEAQKELDQLDPSSGIVKKLKAGL